MEKELEIHFTWNGYWNRAWIVQELVLAKGVMFLAGEAALCKSALLEYALEYYYFSSMFSESKSIFESGIKGSGLV